MINQYFWPDCFLDAGTGQDRYGVDSFVGRASLQVSGTVQLPTLSVPVSTVGLDRLVHADQPFSALVYGVQFHQSLLKDILLFVKLNPRRTLLVCFY